MGFERLQLLGVYVVCAICSLCLAQEEESVVRAKLGGVAELGCSLASTLPLFPLHVVEWVRRDFDIPVLIKFGAYAPRVHPSYEGRVSLSHGATLLVKGVQMEDEGWFECRILQLNRTTAGSRNGTWVFLSVSAPPVFTQTPPPFLEVLQGSPLALTCSAHGNPPPIITWRKDDTEVGRGEEAQVLDGTLTVVSVTKQSAGVYECHVSNTEGNLSHATKLRVKGPPTILLPPKDTMLNLSQNALLRCQAEAYPPNMTYVWQRQGENVYHIDSLKSRVKILVDGTLLIPTVIPEDSGNYTCMPTNGLLTPPTASAYLTVKHPAQVVQMPKVTYLPAGMGGTIVCPVRAEPPLLSVSWTKDGRALDLNTVPGWMLTSEGSLFIAATNEDAVGTYTCTPYNSYGTMGPSQPTQVVLQDPPSFRVSPLEEYRQKVSTELAIPCQAHGDPSPSITWAKVGPAPRSPYVVAHNGSLVLQPLSKDHQGAWVCRATNRVASVTVSTQIYVLGTSPHAVSLLSVVPGMDQANVSWVPGFDGGNAQKFIVWLKQTFGQKQEWVSFPISPSVPHLLVTGLLPNTSYQFSVLPQNKVGPGPFSEIATVQTLVPLTEPPPVAMVPNLAPPVSLSVNETSMGIILKWVLPLPQASPITGFIVQSRLEREEDWRILNQDIGANDTEILLQGLMRDCSYELRMLSHRDGLTGMPSQSINASTTGMGMYPGRTRLLDDAPAAHMAGILGGVGFLCVAILLLLGMAFFVSRKKRRRRRKKRGDIPDALQKCPATTPGSNSPDSVLKMKVCLFNSIFPRFPTSHSDYSSTDGSSCNEFQDQGRQLLSHPHLKSCLAGETEEEGIPPGSTLESISRGPDGRFVVQPEKDSSAPGHAEHFPECPGGGLGSGQTSHWGSRKSYSLCSERDEKADMALVLSVDLPDISEGSYSDSDSYIDPYASTRRCTPASGDLGGMFPRWGRREGHAGYLPQEWELAHDGALVRQMERERETGHLSRCLTLAREREALERELERCEARLSLRAWRRETDGVGSVDKGHTVQKRESWNGASGWEDLQFQETDRPLLDHRGGCHLGGGTAEPTTSSSSCAQRENSQIALVSSQVAPPGFTGRQGSQHTVRVESKEVPYNSFSLHPFPHTTPDSTCQLSDDIKAEVCHWRAPPKEDTSLANPITKAGAENRDQKRDQKTSDASKQRLLEGGGIVDGGDDDGEYKEHLSGSTWPYRRQASKEHTIKVLNSMGMPPDDSSSPNHEKEVARTHLWKSDKYLFTDEQRPETREVHAQKDHETGLSPYTLREEHPAACLGPSSNMVLLNRTDPKRLRSEKVGSHSRAGSSEESQSESEKTLRRSLKRSQSLVCESQAVQGGKEELPTQFRRSVSHRRSDSHKVRASRGLSLDLDSYQPATGSRDNKSLTHALDPTLHEIQTHNTQGSRTTPTSSGCDTLPCGHGQDPMPAMYKTLRRGQSRTREVEQKSLKKSNSLRSHRQEHHANSENPISERSHGTEFPSPEVWVRSLSLGCSSRSPLSAAQGPEEGESASHHQSHVTGGSPFYSPPLKNTPSSPAAAPAETPSPDPRRQATALPEASGWPMSCQEAPPPLQLESIAPQGSTIPQYPSNPSDSIRDTAIVPSLSQPGHTLSSQEVNSTQREEQEREVGQGMEEEMGACRDEEGRGSYASQSSGRGSLGPLSRQSSSLSPSPILPTTDTLQESEEGERRRPSVDENYEWDAADFYLDSDGQKAPWTCLNHEGIRGDVERLTGFPHLKDFDQKGDPLYRSLCVADYQLSPESTCSREPCLDHEPETVLF
ncbi:hypothetical protein AGOR_G00011430 [Albula goreensis]|uniref:Uncharacterized protein n=1 Tax=Albula goreensis TaxID=1534307 RepID=A0A8T3EC04_9TELE|nr:hypothetical protein AGOR_G00011430 [Albula goreensis]